MRNRLRLFSALILASFLTRAQTAPPPILEAENRLVIDDGYDHAEISVNPWGGSHGIFFGSKINYTGSDHLWGSGNARYAQAAGAYGYGAFSMGYIANGGIFSFYDGGQSTGAGNPISWNPVMTFVRGGRIGIGTTEPSEKLHVAGTIRSSNLLINSGEAVYFGNSNTYISANTLGQFAIAGNGNVRLVIEGSGNVGIGTDSPGTNKLAVEGTIAARKVKITEVSPWPDYVFDPAYKLPALSEVEAFIKQNKHLPDVPPAKEVAEKGLDLGDNQALLLKKIEELTLYVIVQQKILEEQGQQIQELKSLSKPVAEISKEKAAIK